MTRVRPGRWARWWARWWLAGLPLLVCLLLLSGGFLWFLGLTLAAPAPPARADGIVVLTGGADRIATALGLLANGRARVLLVSGVGGDAGFGDLARETGADPALRSRVTLGRRADSTYGNAVETAAWARARHIGSLIVVTAYYHMPRALAELGRALPRVTLYPVAVRPPAPRGLATARLLVGEYAKFLAAEAGLSGLAERAGSGTQAGEQQTDTAGGGPHPARMGG